MEAGLLYCEGEGPGERGETKREEKKERRKEEETERRKRKLQWLCTGK